MKIFENLEEVKNIEPCCIALGNFDGVHVGHQALIKAAVEKAGEKGLKSAVFTFSTLPKNLIQPQDGLAGADHHAFQWRHKNNQHQCELFFANSKPL